MSNQYIDQNDPSYIFSKINSKHDILKQDSKNSAVYEAEYHDVTPKRKKPNRTYYSPKGQMKDHKNHHKNGLPLAVKIFLGSVAIGLTAGLVSCCVLNPKEYSIDKSSLVAISQSSSLQDATRLSEATAKDLYNSVLEFEKEKNAGMDGNDVYSARNNYLDIARQVYTEKYSSAYNEAVPEKDQINSDDLGIYNSGNTYSIGIQNEKQFSDKIMFTTIEDIEGDSVESKGLRTYNNILQTEQSGFSTSEDSLTAAYEYLTEFASENCIDFEFDQSQIDESAEHQIYEGQFHTYQLDITDIDKSDDDDLTK